MNFESMIIAFSDRFLSQRTFELVVAPALGDLEFEQSLGRRSLSASRAAVLRAALGALMLDARSNAGIFFKLTLVSVTYFTFPIAMSVKMHETWTEFFTAAAVMVVLSLAPVIICFWPERPNARSGG